MNDIQELKQEPAVNLSKRMYLLYTVALLHSLADGKDTGIGRFAKSLVQIFQRQRMVAYETVHALPYHTQALLDCLLEGTAYGHYLAHGLHA